ASPEDRCDHIPALASHTRLTVHLHDQGCVCKHHPARYTGNRLSSCFFVVKASREVKMMLIDRFTGESRTPGSAQVLTVFIVKKQSSTFKANAIPRKLHGSTQDHVQI